MGLTLYGVFVFEVFARRAACLQFHYFTFDIALAMVCSTVSHATPGGRVGYRASAASHTHGIMAIRTRL